MDRLLGDDDTVPFSAEGRAQGSSLAQLPVFPFGSASNTPEDRKAMVCAMRDMNASQQRALEQNQMMFQSFAMQQQDLQRQLIEVSRASIPQQPCTRWH